MPYISQKARTKYDYLIDTLARILDNRSNNDELVGEMTYVLFRLAKLLCHKESGKECNFARKAVVSSALSEALAEFRRRIMALHEDGKIIENGDVE